MNLRPKHDPLGLDTSDLDKVDFALSKLNRAYATERISKALFRRQRASLIVYLQTVNKPFPDVILNEYSQTANIEFEGEETPVVDDLGFSTTSAKAETLRINPALQLSIPPELPSRSPESFGAQNRSDFDDSEESSNLMDFDEPKQQSSNFDRFYWVYLGVFMFAVMLLVFTQ